MREIADATTTTRGGVTRAVNRLVDAGWVRRVECPDDGRGSLAELTEAGAAKLGDAAPGHVASVRRHLFDLLSPADVDRFARLYAAILDHLHESTRETTG
jgi:DNA-binding MarR family transcriptional regulator